MSSERQMNLSSPERKERGEGTILRSVPSVPLFYASYDLAAAAYSSTKENRPYMKSFCDKAEKGMKTLTGVADGRAQPILTKREPQIARATVSEYASKGLGTLEEKLPLLQLTPDQTVSGAKEAALSTMARAKDAVANQVSGVLGTTKEGSVEASKSIVSHSLNTIVESRTGQVAAVGAEEVLLGRSEKLVDQYLPITSLELVELATNLKEGDVVPVQPQEYLVRLGALSAKLRHRAYQHSLRKIKVTRQSIYYSLSQLQQTLDLIKHMKQDVGKKLHESQEKLHQLWLEWSKMNPEAKDETDAAQPEVEAQTLTMFHKITQQLQAACQMLASVIQGFPSSLQEKVQQVRQSSGELHASFSAVGSFQELSSSLLTQSREKVLKAQGYMNEVFDYVIRNTPLTWLVGPFLLSGRLPTEVADPAQ